MYVHIEKTDEIEYNDGTTKIFLSALGDTQKNSRTEMESALN